MRGRVIVKKAIIVKKLIEDKKVSLRAFSEKANIPYTTLRSMLERGIGNASVDNVLKVCKALGITAEKLDALANGENISSEDDSNMTIAAHHDGIDWTEEEMKELEDFKKYVLSKRQKQ